MTAKTNAGKSDYDGSTGTTDYEDKCRETDYEDKCRDNLLRYFFHSNVDICGKTDWI